MGMSKELILFFDCGDTIVDESTQVFDESGIVLHASFLPGAGEMLASLHAQGYRMALVADGLTASFQNILRELGIGHLFEARIISQEVGVCKPDARMFREALEKMRLTAADAGRIVMIGNNLKRDVLGANRMGFTSVLLSCSPRYVMRPETAEETPDYVAAMPREVPGLIRGLEERLGGGRGFGVSGAKGISL